MTKVNKPKIRFNKFENTWTKSKLGELYEVYSGNTPTRSDSRNYQNGEIPWIKTTDLNNSIICANEEKISVYGATKLKVLPEKSVLIAMYGGFNQIGRTGLLIYPATINQALAALMPVNEINPNFLLNFLNFKKESWRNVAASSRKDPNITKNDVEKFIISFPSLPEQTAIGTLFRSLDDLLASYKDNLANYQSLKATMLSKMFPKAGQTVPEIRLDGFEGEWKEKTLGSLGSVAMNKRIFKNETSENGDIPFYKIGTFGRTADAFISKEKFKEYKEKYPYPEIGDILISASGSIGRTVVYNGEDAYYQDSNIVWLKHDQQLDNSYLKQYYGIIKWSGIEGTTIKRLYNKNIIETNIFLPPSVVEQQAIGSYFSNLDNLINSHQEKISQLETLKKKLLQDMFI